MNEDETKNKQSYPLGIISLDYNISSSFPKQISFLKDYKKFTKIQIDFLHKKKENDKIDLSLTEKKNYSISDILQLLKKRSRSSPFSEDLGFNDDEGEIKPSSKEEMLKLFFSLKQEKLKSIKTPEIDLKDEEEIYNIIAQFQVKNESSSLSEDNFNIKKNKIIKQFVLYYKKYIKHPVIIQRFIDKLSQHTNENGELLKVYLII